MSEKKEKIKKSESPPKIIKNLYSKNEIRDFLKLYENFQQQYIIKSKMLLKKDGFKDMT